MGGKYTRPATTNPRPGVYDDSAAAAVEITNSRTSSRNEVPTPLTEILHYDPVLDLTADGFFSETVRQDEIDPAKDVRIGWTTLTVPPEEIDVIEDRYNEEVDILRGRGRALVKTGRGHIRIQMPLKFADFEDVNFELRPILAQFRTCPFTMLESDVVSTSVLLRHADTSAVETIQAAREARATVLENYNFVKTVAIEKLAKYRGQLLGAGLGVYEDLAERLQSEPPKAIHDVLKQLMAFYTTPQVRWGNSGGGLWGLSPNDSFIQDLESVRQHAHDADKLLGALFDRSRELAEAELRGSFAYPAVPVALHQIVCQTVPGYPQMLQANLEMFYFNTEPFMPVTTFVGPIGNPTGDITECPVYWDHVKQRLGPEARHKAEHLTLNTGLGYMSEATNGFMSLEYPTTKVKRVKKDAPKLSALSFVIPTPEGSDEDENFEYRTVTDTFVASNKDADIIIKQVTVGLENKLSPQPIEGHMYGTLQYMGQMNAKIQVVLTVTGDTESDMSSHLQRIHMIKKQTEEIAHVHGEKARRNARILIEHDLVRLFGVQHVLLDRVRTRTTGINTVEVTLNFTEFTTSLEKRERLLMSATDTRDRIHLEALVYMSDVATAYLTGYGSGTALNHVSQAWDGPTWAVDALYGGLDEYGDSIRGLITEDILTEAFYNVPALQKSIDNRIIEKYGRDVFEEANRQQRTRGENRVKPSYHHEPEVAPETLGQGRFAAANSKTGRVPEYLAWGRAEIKVATDAANQLGTSPLAVLDFSDMRESMMRNLAREHLAYWSRRQLRVPGLHDPDTPPSIMDSSGTITIQARPSRQMLEDVIGVINSGTVDWKAAARLSSVTDTAQSIFSNLRTKVKDIRDAMNPSLVYPDLDLPDYATAFKSLWALIKRQTSIDIPNTKDINEADLPPKVKAIVRRVIPTYDDLGVRPPVSRHEQDFAREITDFVDPDYYFFWTRVKNNQEIVRALDKALEEAESLDAKATRVNPADPDSADRSDLSRAKSEIGVKMVHGDLKPINKYDDDPSPTETVVEGEFVGVVSESSADVKALAALKGGGVGKDFLYKSPDRRMQELTNDINPNDTDHRKRLFKAAVASVPDRFRRLITAFPAFKVELAEVDSEQHALWDDFYGYNSIKSIRIHNHKYTPSIAEIEVVNVTGNLDERRTLSSDQAKDKIERRYRSGAYGRESDTGDPADLPHFFLEAGTPITIRLGYSSKPDELEVRFVGQIVSVSAGDITRIVAQCYSSELTTPLNEVVDGRNWFSIVNRIMERSPTLHYGQAYELLGTKEVDRRGLRNSYTGWLIENSLDDDELGITDDKLMNSHDAARWRPRNLGKILLGKLGYLPSLDDRYIGHILANSKTTNVFLPLENTARRAISEGDGPRWGIPNVTGLEALHEVSRHLPGFVTATRPYETRGGGQQVTLFFGKPEQPYTYTAQHLDEEEEWRKTKRLIRAGAEDKTSELLIRFLVSEQGVAFQTRVAARRGGATEGVIRALSQAYIRELSSIPVKPIGFLSNLAFGWTDIGDTAENWAANVVGGDPLEFTVVANDSAALEFKRVEEKIGHEGMHVIAGLFFTRYNNEMLLGGRMTPEWVRNTYSVFAGAEEAIENIGTLDWWDLFGQIGRVTTLDGGPPPPAGVLLYNYFNWHAALKNLSKKVPTHTDAIEQYVRSVFEEWNGAKDDPERLIATVDQRVMPARYYKSMVRSVIDWSNEWKHFLKYFYMYLQQEDSQDILDTVYNANRKLDELRLGPRMKRFRNHHFAHSAIDIVKNNITTSQEFMANRVLVSYQEDVAFKKVGGDNNTPKYVIYQRPSEPKAYEVGYDDDIQPSDRRVRVVTEPNAVGKYSARFCAKSNLAEAMRPMYRGQMALRGHEKIWPYDILWVHDSYNGVYGPVEVESVIDHMDSTGYNVTVVPHAVTTTESGSEFADLGSVGLWGVGLGAALTLVLAVPTVGASLWVAGLWALSSDGSLKHRTGKGLGHHLWRSVKGWAIGRGLDGKEDSGVRIVPLLRRGAPWTSGLRGIGGGGWKARIEQRWEDVQTGWDLFTSDLNRGINDAAGDVFGG